MGVISPWQLLIILLIVFMLFGTRKLRNLGSDLGGALKGFRSAIKDEETAQTDRKEAERSEEAIEVAAEKAETK